MKKILVLLVVAVMFSCSNDEPDPIIEVDPCADRQDITIQYSAIAVNTNEIEVWYVDGYGNRQNFKETNKGSFILDVIVKEGDSVYLKAQSPTAHLIYVNITKQPTGLILASVESTGVSNLIYETGVKIPCEY